MAVNKPSAPVPLLKNAATAPFIYFDGVPVYGVYAGNIELELSARALMPKPDGSVVADAVCTAHLRCSPGAAMALIDALSKALDMHSKQLEKPADVLSN